VSVDKLNILGAVTSIAILLLSCFVFIFRLVNQQKAEYWSGIVFMLMAIPLMYLFLTAIQLERPTIYFIQLAIMIGFIVLELLLDYVFKINFRTIGWATIAYVMIFFAGTGGMIGIASQAGRSWAIISIILFLIMMILSFLQHVKTSL